MIVNNQVTIIYVCVIQILHYTLAFVRNKIITFMKFLKRFNFTGDSECINNSDTDGNFKREAEIHLSVYYSAWKKGQ